MAQRKYTVAEANELLPHLAPTLVELREKFEDATQIRQTVARAAMGNGWSSNRDRWSRTLARVAELLERLEQWDIVLRDVSTGLVDFPTEMAGDDAYLCWRLGELDVGYWHSTNEGFANRKPL
jgi:hypothetical protein